MIENQKIEIIDENPEHCIFYPKPSNELSSAFRLNAKISPATLVVGIGAFYAGYTMPNSDLRLIGASSIALATLGLVDRLSDLRKKRNENVIFELNPEQDIFTLV